MNDDGIEKLHRYDGFMAILSDSDVTADRY